MKRDQAPFPYELIRLLQKDREGHVSFCYPYQCGRQSHIIKHTQEFVEESSRCRRAGDLRQALQRVVEYLGWEREIGEEIDRQWHEHIENLPAVMAGRRARELEAA